jgi:putative transposase
VIYTFIRNHEKIFPIEKMCKVLQVGQRSYFQWKSGSILDRKQRVELVKEIITSIYFDSKQRYGSPRITAELAFLGNKTSRPESSARTGEAITVAKYMNQLGLRSKLSKKFKVITNSTHKHLIVPNVLNRKFSVAEPSKVWVSDITYIRVKEGFLYLATVLDLYDRKIIGWSLSNGMSVEETSLAAWRMAVKNRCVEKSLVFYSDRGIQYASKKFTNMIDSYKMIARSMSRKGNC